MNKFDDNDMQYMHCKQDDRYLRHIIEENCRLREEIDTLFSMRELVQSLERYIRQLMEKERLDNALKRAELRKQEEPEQND